MPGSREALNMSAVGSTSSWILVSTDWLTISSEEAAALLLRSQRIIDVAISQQHKLLVRYLGCTSSRAKQVILHTLENYIAESAEALQAEQNSTAAQQLAEQRKIDTALEKATQGQLLAALMRKLEPGFGITFQRANQ